ncbi:MAG: anti-sigma factor [Oculatellaceae cyanobacterium bins.114]|nr:anti-sigma factor [Oculatellaceae cyanobacterium bins.114]
MSQPIPPEELQLLIAGYILNDLNDEEAAIVETLLDDPEIAKSVRHMQRTLEMTYDPPEVHPPAHLRESVMKNANRLTDLPFQTNDVVPLTKLPRWVKGLGAVAATLIIGLSISNYWLWRSLQTQQAQTQQAPLVLALQPTDNLDAPASVLVEVNPDTLQGTLMVENLPPLEPGKVYVLWTVLTPDAPFTTDAKNAILTQVFTVEAGNQMQPLIFPKAFQDLNWVKAIAITIEDSAEPQRHNSVPILIRQL